MPGPLQIAAYIGFAAGICRIVIPALYRKLTTRKPTPVTIRKRDNSVSHKAGYSAPSDTLCPVLKALPVEDITPTPPVNDRTKLADRVVNQSLIDDAISAMRNLGMTKAAATKHVKAVYAETDNDVKLGAFVTMCIKAIHVK